MYWLGYQFSAQSDDFEFLERIRRLYPEFNLRNCYVVLDRLEVNETIDLTDSDSDSDIDVIIID